MVEISTVDSSLTPCDCSGWRCQPNALNFKDFISCKKVPPHFKKPMCLVEDAEECNLQPFGSRRWRRKKGFSTASHLQREQNTSLLCSSVHHKTNVNRKVLKITKQFWFKDALSSTLSFLLWILRKEKRIPHISPPRVRHFCSDCCFFVGAVKTASVKNILIDSADGSQPPVSEGPAYVGPRGWSGRSVSRADSFCRGCDVTTALVCIASTDAHWGAERLGRGRRGWFMSTFNMFQRSFLSTFVTVPPTPAAADCRAFKLDIIHLSLSLCVHEKRGSTKPELNRGPLRSKTPQTLNWAEDSVMQIFCDAEAKALMRSLQVFFLPVCVCVCVCRPPRPKTESVEGRRNQGDDRCGRASPRCIELARIDPAFTLQINMFKPSQVDFLPSNTWLCCESSGRKLLERKSRSCWTFELLASWKMEQPCLMTFWWNKHGDFKMQTTKKIPARALLQHEGGEVEEVKVRR